MPQINDFEAHIAADGEVLEEFQTKTLEDWRTITCFIPSKTNQVCSCVITLTYHLLNDSLVLTNVQRFCINLRNWENTEWIRTHIYLDGILVSKFKMRPGENRIYDAVRTSETNRRSMLFANLNLTGK